MAERFAWWAWPTEYQDEGMVPIDAADAEEALVAAREALSADVQEGEPMDVSVRRVTADDVHELQQRVEDLQRAAGGADTARFLADQAAKIRALEARAQAAEQERDELAATGAAIVGALEERDMARAERDAARARIRELEARAEQAERERDEARRQVAALTEGLRLVSDAMARLDNIYRADIDLGDPPVETPAWLQEAQHRAAALLAPTAPAAGKGEKRCPCGHPPHLGPCTRRNGGTANPCPCLRDTLPTPTTPAPELSEEVEVKS